MPRRFVYAPGVFLAFSARLGREGVNPSHQRHDRHQRCDRDCRRDQGSSTLYSPARMYTVLAVGTAEQMTAAIV